MSKPAPLPELPFSVNTTCPTVRTRDPGCVCVCVCPTGCSLSLLLTWPLQPFPRAVSAGSLRLLPAPQPSTGGNLNSPQAGVPVPNITASRPATTLPQPTCTVLSSCLQCPLNVHARACLQAFARAFPSAGKVSPYLSL